MQKLILATALLVACGPGTGPTQPEQYAAMGLLAAPGCVDPTDERFGAIADDGLDDRAALQAAIDYACSLPATSRHVCLPRGKFHAVRNPRIGATNLASLQIRCDDFELSGEGTYSTTIAMLGTGVDPRDLHGPNDWWLVDAQGGARLHVHDLALDGSERVDNNEQTHLLQLKGPLQSPLIERIRTVLPDRQQPAGSAQCIEAPNGTMCETPGRGDEPVPCHPYFDSSGLPRYGLVGGACSVSQGIDGTPRWTLLGWYGGGDCVRLLGEEAEDTGGEDQLIYFATIRDWEAPICDRSALGLQRGHDDTLIEDASLVTYSDQVIDSEPTGRRGYRRLIVRGVNTSRGTEQGGLTESYTGSSEGTSSVTRDCRGGTIPDGAVRLFDMEDATFINCNFDSGVASFEPTVGIMKRGRRIRFIGGSIRRPPGAPPGPLIHITHQGDSPAPVSVVLEGVALEQGTMAPIIKMSAGRAFTMRDCSIVYRGPPWTGTGTAAIIAEAIGGDIDSISLSRVTFTAPPGSYDGLIVMSPASGRHIGGVSLTDVTISPGSLRRYVTSFFGGRAAALHATHVVAPALATISGGTAPVLCGGGCPP